MIRVLTKEEWTERTAPIEKTMHDVDGERFCALVEPKTLYRLEKGNGEIEICKTADGEYELYINDGSGEACIEVIIW